MDEIRNKTVKGFDMSSKAHSIDWCREHVGHPGCNEALKEDSEHLPKEIMEAEQPKRTIQDELKELGEWKVNMCTMMIQGHVAYLPPICAPVAKASNTHVDPEIRKVCFGKYADCMHDPTTKHDDCITTKNRCLLKSKSQENISLLKTQ